MSGVWGQVDHFDFVDVGRLHCPISKELFKVLGPGALGRPRGIGWRGRWEGGSG